MINQSIFDNKITTTRIEYTLLHSVKLSYFLSVLSETIIVTLIRININKT